MTPRGTSCSLRELYYKVVTIVRKAGKRGPKWPGYTKSLYTKKNVNIDFHRVLSNSFALEIVAEPHNNP